MTDPLSFVRPDFADIGAYAPVQPIAVLAAEIGMDPEQIVKLDANENLYGTAPVIRAALACGDYNIYPDPAQTALRLTIAKYLGVEVDQVVAGAGADDLIDILLRLTLPEAIAIPTPTFGMYEFLGRVGGARVIEVPRGEDFEVDVSGIAAAVEDGAGMVFLTSPNNPTGNLLSAEDLDVLCGLDALVVVDEAYAEFSGSSLIGALEWHSNLVILRTLSKWAGLAGLRVGYGACHPALAHRMMAIKQPYNVNVAAEVAAQAAFANKETILRSVERIVLERDRLATLLAEFDWLSVAPSSGNFLLVKVNGMTGVDLAAKLRNKGVLVRAYDRDDLREYIRISAGRPQDTDRLIEALREVKPS
jgi:histidinol-phosphate aminotransferase